MAPGSKVSWSDFDSDQNSAKNLRRSFAWNWLKHTCLAPKLHNKLGLLGKEVTSELSRRSDRSLGSQGEAHVALKARSSCGSQRACAVCTQHLLPCGNCP